MTRGPRTKALLAACGAKTRTGATCKTLAMTNGRCRMHGGTNTKPKPQDGNTKALKHGLYSRFISPDEAAMLADLTDETLTDELALMRVRLYRLLQLSEKAEGAVGLEGAYDVTRKLQDEFNSVTRTLERVDRLEVRLSVVSVDEMIMKLVEKIAKLELDRARLAVHRKQLNGGDDTGVRKRPGKSG